jgi:hypothetical protein
MSRIEMFARSVASSMPPAVGRDLRVAKKGAGIPRPRRTPGLCRRQPILTHQGVHDPRLLELHGPLAGAVEMVNGRFGALLIHLQSTRIEVLHSWQSSCRAEPFESVDQHIALLVLRFWNPCHRIRSMRQDRLAAGTNSICVARSQWRFTRNPALASAALPACPESRPSARHGAAPAVRPGGKQGYRIFAMGCGVFLQTVRSNLAAGKRILSAGPVFHPLDSPRRWCQGRDPSGNALEDAGDTDTLGSGGRLCPAHWPGNAGSLAAATSDEPRPGTQRRSSRAEGMLGKKRRVAPLAETETPGQGTTETLIRL